MATPRRERKVVTVVFCDLVGFTSRAESLDPEDVAAILRPYHARVRAELEHYGGTVEKFIGDAVMALFGAPVAHEDDPERAVRAALAIREFAGEDGLELRVGITTGEALVSLDASLAEGEGMASGDVVNTAARLQSAAPVNGVIVDETTYRATRQAVDYREAEPVEAKGKAEPIAVWEATEARARPGVDVAHDARAALVGRQYEVGVLRDALQRIRQTRTTQLVTLVGVPGIGKSRLVYELRGLVDADPDIITWRQGRCLAYGDGVTLWALGEIVKAQAGIHEQDPPEEASAKMHRIIDDAFEDASEARWVESHLAALIGLGRESQLGGDRRNEAFAAWRRFFEAMADQRPFIFVVEDLHWADESLLDFVDELVEWVTHVPLLVVATARPELLQRRPGWGGGKLNATTLALEPLPDEDTAALIAELLDRVVLAAESQQALLERAGGNPLYAEQFAELFLEQGSTEALSLPETLQGIISARLDALSRDEKELLHDAAVVGKVFWVGSLRRDEAESLAALHSLARKAFVIPQRRSSVEGESEFAFSHALVRDVAYGQIARADRAEKHGRTAEWIESLGRREDHAEMLVYHWNAALELAEAAGTDTGDIAERARVASRAAGDRAATLSAFATAAGHYRSALARTADQAADRPEVLFRLARTLFDLGDEEAEGALREALGALTAAGDRESAAECEALLARIMWFRGEQDRVFPHLRAAEALIAGAGPSPSVARVLGWSGRHEMLAGDQESGLRLGEEALAMAERLELDDLRVHALTTIGSAKEFSGDTTGRDDLERAIEIGRASNSAMVAGALNNLMVVLDMDDLDRCDRLAAEALQEAERFGNAALARFVGGNRIGNFCLLGRWDDAMAIADRFIAECAESPHVLESQSRQFRGYMRLARGLEEEALEDMAIGLELARQHVDDPQTVAPALVRSAWAYFQMGRTADARALFAEALPYLRKDPNAKPWTMPEVAVDLGEEEAIREVVLQLRPSPGRRAMLAVLDGALVEAAEAYAAVGIRLFEAEARLRAGERLCAAGRTVEGKLQLETALAFYRSVGATHFVERGEALLATAQSESA